MGTGASAAAALPLPDAPAMSQDEYVKEHHKFWEAYKDAQWKEAYKYMASQTTAGAFAALGERNYENCVRFAVGAIGHTQESPKDIEEAAAVLCRSVEVAKWPATKAASFLMDHPKRTEVAWMHVGSLAATTSPSPGPGSIFEVSVPRVRRKSSRGQQRGKKHPSGLKPFDSLGDGHSLPCFSGRLGGSSGAAPGSH